MKFTSTLVLSLAAVATSVSASPSAESRGGGYGGQCSGYGGSSAQCCEQTGYGGEGYFGLLGLLFEIPEEILFGYECNLLNYGGYCENNYEPVCCTENNYYGHNGLSYGCQKFEY
ncbi:hypothetical protein BT96DRAFT_918032 [Gymnopus androsaceus JB14]|uniref:Hydrophobin n=1 Tax=Gymnopus androsaceus JB14 TaxID=1447944 RepID=A0A6A4HW85_9AGAR|nr:hypothetical protein BT96DRAFT_918032 [Gymnopus androsaceus JB14]